MFDLIAGKAVHTPHAPAVPILLSTMAHGIAVGLLIVLPVLYATDRIPEPSTMMAFVAAPPLPPPPPPPPPPKIEAAPARPKSIEPVEAAALPTPVEPPTVLVSEQPDSLFDDEGAVGGVEGGMPGGIIGGVVGGLDIETLPPPPPPHPPRGPLRVGGAIEEPALLHRVNPVYPPQAVSAGIEGTVVLEALVGKDGHVEELRVLRGHRLLEKAALDAVRQWRYSPVLLNGHPERFILTVVVSFRITD
jgi:protein TonB